MLEQFSNTNRERSAEEKKGLPLRCNCHEMHPEGLIIRLSGGGTLSVGTNHHSEGVTLSHDCNDNAMVRIFLTEISQKLVLQLNSNTKNLDDLWKNSNVIMVWSNWCIVPFPPFCLKYSYQAYTPHAAFVRFRMKKLKKMNVWLETQ